MKRLPSLIALFVLLHLLIIDLTFYIMTAGVSDSILALSAYNLVWLVIAIMVGKHTYEETRGN